MHKLLKSSQFRLSLVYLCIFGASVLLLLAFLYWATVGYMARQTEATIDAEIQGLAEQYRRLGLTGLSALLAERTRFNASSVYLLTDSRLTPLIGNLGLWPEGTTDEHDWLSFRLPVATEAGPEMHLARARRFRLHGDFHLLVGRDVQELAEVESLLRRALTWGLGITCLLGLIGAIMMSRSAVARIDSINQTTRSIMAGELHRRVPTSGSDDDFDELAENLNAMLDRIEQLMEDVRRVSDNIAHDLRTPLMRLRNYLDMLANGRSLAHEDTETVRIAIGEADGLLTAFNALLRIARLEADQRRQRFATVCLDELVDDIAEYYEPLAEESGLTLEVATGPAVEISGDRDLLFQALANVVDNAIKYTPSPGHVELRLSNQDQTPTIEVEDSGPGIAHEARDWVLKRFVRLDESRTTPGNGLGLSLVAAVAKLHRAKLELTGERGLLVKMLFTSATSGPPALSNPNPGTRTAEPVAMLLVAQAVDAPS